MTTALGTGTGSKQQRGAELAGLLLLAVVVALLALRYGGGLRHGGFAPGDGSLRQRVVLWTVVPAALLAAGVLVARLGALRSRVAGVTAGVAASVVLLLPAVAVARIDAAGEQNGFAGCGTFLDPQGFTAACEAALGWQRTTVLVLVAVAAVPAVLSLLHAAGLLPATGGRTARR